MTKTIFHLDLDSFFVSAERLKNPALRGKPVAVGGSGGRGVVASCSYEARKFGVRSAMPMSQALRLCPQLIVVGSSFDLYSTLSRRVFELVSEFTPVYEATGIDEGFLDMTGTESLWGPPMKAAELIRARVLKETGLTCSIGIASNRMVAKVATDFCKPNGVHQVPPGKEAEFLAPLPVGKIPFIGPATEEWLHQRAVFRVADLQRMNPENLRAQGKQGEFLLQVARGEGGTEFNVGAKTRSISRETTFEKNLLDPERIEKEIWEMACDLGQSLREEGARAHTMKLKLRYPPFETVSRSRVLERETASDQELFDAFLRLFRQHWDGERPLRLLGVGCTLAEPASQLDLFHDQESAKKPIDDLKDRLRQRFGENALKTGRDLSGPDKK